MTERASKRLSPCCGRPIYAVLSELDAARERIAEVETQLGAWHKMFGTTQLTHAIAARDALRAEVEAGERECWHAFGALVWRWLAENWDTEFGWDIAEMAVTAGLAEHVKYDPAIHGECEADSGDDIIYPLKGDPAFVSVAAVRAEERERCVTVCCELTPDAEMGNYLVAAIRR